MMQRELGRSEITVSAMGLGLWQAGGVKGTGSSADGWDGVTDDESIRVIHTAMEHGINLFDTAASYGAGHSERLLARALEGRRDQAIIATKFGYRVDEAAKQVIQYNDPPREGDLASHVREECEASLRRLNTDHIDLYQLHINDYDPQKAPAVREACEALVKDGKIRYYGWSTDFPEGARVFAQGEHCTAIQVDMSVMHDNPGILAVCDEFNLAAINRGPLGMGLLTGKYKPGATWSENDIRASGVGWFKDGFLPMLDRVDDLREVLTSGGRTMAQGCLAWLWARSYRNIPIPGAKRVSQLEENAKAMEFGPLTPDQMQQIEVILGRGEAATV